MRAGLGETQISEAWRAFRARLYRRNFSQDFIENYAVEPFAQAKLEFVDAQNRGVEIRSPVGWLIECAWRRTLDLVDYETRRPRSVSLDALLIPPSCERSTPEEIALINDQARCLHAVLDLLHPKERDVVKLVHLEELPYTHAAARLGCSGPTVEYWHSKAMERLREIGESRDFDVGFDGTAPQPEGS